MKKYDVTKLYYLKIWGDPLEAFQREKQIQAGPRKEKIAAA